MAPRANRPGIQKVKLTNRRASRNDAVVPVNGTYSGCDHDADGLCSFDNVVSLLQQRIEEIDYDYDCFGNYTAQAGVDYNGRAPK